jgi:hypothetical protein
MRGPTVGEGIVKYLVVRALGFRVLIVRVLGFRVLIVRALAGRDLRGQDLIVRVRIVRVLGKTRAAAVANREVEQ